MDTLTCTPTVADVRPVKSELNEHVPQPTQDLHVMMALYWEAKDAYQPENSDHRHLRDCLLVAAAVLHREKLLTDHLYAMECESLGVMESEAA